MAPHKPIATTAKGRCSLTAIKHAHKAPIAPSRSTQVPSTRRLRRRNTSTVPVTPLATTCSPCRSQRRFVPRRADAPSEPCGVRKFDAEVETGVEAERLEPFAEPGACVAHLTGA